MNRQRGESYWQRRQNGPRIPMIVEGISRSGEKVECNIQFGDRHHTVFFESHDLLLEPVWEAVLPLTLSAAMKHASSLQVGAEIDPLLFGNLDTLQEKLLTTDRRFIRIPINDLREKQAAVSKAKGVGLFFSGGVDSWFSLLDHLEQVTHLVLVQGVDVRLDDTQRFKMVEALGKRVAEHYGKRLVIVRTNLREFSDKYLHWYINLENLMQSIALLFTRDIGWMYLGAAFSTSGFIQLGLDPNVSDLWSTGAISLKHDGLHKTRMQKVACLIQEPFALENLRVCWEHKNSELNCCQCEKCLRTMLSLQAVGYCGPLPTFNQPLTPKLIRNFDLGEHGGPHYAEENLDALNTLQGNSPIVKALRHAILTHKRKKWLRKHLPGVFGFVSGLKRLLT